MFLAPDFVGSMTQNDFVYFFFRETAVEYINCGKVNITFYKLSFCWIGCFVNKKTGHGF